jgi:hypothetical protein
MIANPGAIFFKAAAGAPGLAFGHAVEIGAGPLELERR